MDYVSPEAVNEAQDEIYTNIADVLNGQLYIGGADRATVLRAANDIADRLRYFGSDPTFNGTSFCNRVQNGTPYTPLSEKVA